jgi:hypothetical protein
LLAPDGLDRPRHQFLIQDELRAVIQNARIAFGARSGDGILCDEWLVDATDYVGKCTITAA